MSDVSDLFDFEDEIDGTKSWLGWLEAVAVRVDELVADPGVMDHFRRLLREWKREDDARRPSSQAKKRQSYIQHDPVQFFPRRRLTRADKYARLAAIHDIICEKVKRIDVWSTHKGWGRGYGRAKAGLSYEVLQSRVGELKDADRSRVEKMLGDVEADLIAIAKKTRSPVRHEPDQAPVHVRHEHVVRNVNEKVDQNPYIADEALKNYVPADTLLQDHGIPQSRLSEGANAVPPKIRTKPATPGTKSNGKPVRLLYHRGDAIKHASPKHIQARTRRKFTNGV